MRRDYSTSRGSQSLDGEALEKAKQQLKQAQKKGFSSIIERFDNDVDFTLHSVAGGFDREFLAIEDVLTHSALPNLGRSQEQRTLGVGAYGGGAGGFDREFLAIEDVLTHSALPNLGRSQEQRTLGVGAYGGGQQAEMARNEAIARLLYMHDVNPAALRAGLIDAVTDLPFCIMWLGGTYSVRKFVDVFLQHKIAQQIVMFSGGPIYLDHTAGYTAEQWYEWIVARLSQHNIFRACRLSRLIFGHPSGPPHHRSPDLPGRLRHRRKILSCRRPRTQRRKDRSAPGRSRAGTDSSAIRNRQTAPVAPAAILAALAALPSPSLVDVLQRLSERRPEEVALAFGNVVPASQKGSDILAEKEHLLADTDALLKPRVQQPSAAMGFGILDLVKPFSSKLIDKARGLADGAIDLMGNFVDGVAIFGCPSHPKVVDTTENQKNNCSSKGVDKPKDLAGRTIDFMGDFVDGVKIFGCPSQPKVVDMVEDKTKGLARKLVDKARGLADAAIERMGDFVDGVKIFGCPSRPPLADEVHRSELPQNVREIDPGLI
eukprot:s6883_g3.t1